MIQVVRIEEAIGYPLAHDITEIRAGEFKGPAFLKGHMLTCRDLDHLRRLGKDHLYILKSEDSEMHEDDAARAIANALCGDGVFWDEEPREGKISLKAARDGLLTVDVDALTRFNELGEVMCATLHTNTIIKKGDQVAATRAIPLLIAGRIVNRAVATAKEAREGVLQVKSMMSARAGVMITGSFDLIYPRILAGNKITRKDIAATGHGGLCLKCKHCTFPNCSFGK